MSKFKFEVQYKDHDGQEKKRVVEVEEENNDIDRAIALAEFTVKGSPTDRDPNSFEQAPVIEILTIEEVKDDV